MVQTTSQFAGSHSVPDRHLKEAGSSTSIAKDKEFVNSRKILEGKARFMRERGYGKRPRESKAQTKISLPCSINKKQHGFFGEFEINTGS